MSYTVDVTPPAERDVRGIVAYLIERSRPGAIS